jgi:uncharacterized RDD family membrane protein YckC
LYILFKSPRIVYNSIMEGVVQNNQIPTPPAQQSPQIIVPPATIQIKAAGAWVRFWASVIDGLIIGIPYFLILSLIYSPFVYGYLSVSLPGAYFTIILLLPIEMLLYSAYLTVRKGATWGKDAYGLRVVRYKTDNNISYKQSFLRDLIKSGLYIIPIVSGVFSLINGFTILFSSEKRGIHDKIAGTQVIKFKNAWSIRKQLAILLPLLVIFIFSFALYRGTLSIKVHTFQKMYEELNNPTQNGSSSLNKIIKEYGGTKRQISQANNTMRSSNINEILNAVNQYMADNQGKIPNGITTTAQEISSTGADICSVLFPAYLFSLPVDPIINEGKAITDCKTPYSTGYVIFKDSSTNKVTVRATNAELGEKIEVTR